MANRKTKPRISPVEQPFGIFDQIHRQYEELSATEKRIADWILTNAGNATSLSISEIAANCGVGEATIFRFCKQFGVAGFREFRLMLAKDLASRPILPDMDEPHADIDPSDDIANVVQKVIRANIETLYQVWEKLDGSEIEKAVAVLARAKRILIYGEGSSGVISQDAEYRLLRVGLPVEYHVSHMAFVSSALLTSEDATIAISHSGRTREVVEVQTLARSAGAQTICITSFPKSPLAEASAIKLIAPANQTYFSAESIPWRIVQLTLIDILSVRMWQHFGRDFCRLRAGKIDSALKLRRL